MKGIIVLDDIPENCMVCPIETCTKDMYGYETSYECPFEYKGYTGEFHRSKRADWCPIKPMSKEVEMQLFREGRI